MKQLYYLILFGVGWIFSIQVSAQDLIERTQLGATIDVSRHQPSVAFQESQSLKHAGAYQEISPFFIAPNSRSSAVDKFIEGQVMLDLPEGTLPRLINSLKDGVALGIPVAPGKEIILDLVEVFPINSEFVGRTSEGETFTLSDYPARFYRGAIKDVPNSFASITIADGMFRGLIGDDYGNYVLAELNGSQTEFILYNDQKLKIEQDFTCGVEAVPFSSEQQEILRLPERVTNVNRSDDCIDIMVEMERDLYIDAGNSTAGATNYVFALLNEVATLYNNENISITLKDMILWSSTDPYTSTSMCNGASNNLLREFSNERANAFNGRLAHLITGRSAGGGCAWIDVLCNSYINSLNKSNHAVSSGMASSITGFPTYSWSVMVFAHEMGHNVGSNHTHDCVWNGNGTAIDGCGPTSGCSDPGDPAGGGTIMSYCHQKPVGINFNLGFGPQPGNILRNETYGSSCVLDCGNVTACPRQIYLDGNVDTDTYYANDKVEMSGRVLNGRTVNLRCDIGAIHWDAGFRVDLGGYLSAGTAVCNYALTNDESD